MSDIQTCLPLRETTFFILLSLSSVPKHGYAIMKDVEHLSDGRVSLSTGTLYGAIKRLLEQGWIRRVDDPHPDNTDRVRKTYKLTELGRKVLNAEITRMQRLVNVAQIQTVGGIS